MASAKQLAANRANSQKSTGPRTDAGKNIARLNAVQHGLSGHAVLRTPEQDAALQAYSARLMPDLSPCTAVEHDFAERIIYDSWRVHRASAIESNLFSLADTAFDTGNPDQDDALNDAHTFQVNDKSLNLLSLYQQRLQRGIHRDLEMLRKMQKERKAEAAKAPQPVVAAPRPSLQLVDKPSPLPVIGSVCPTPPSASSPPPSTVENDPSNMAA
jgi:hypothetical protein